MRILSPRKSKFGLAALALLLAASTGCVRQPTVQFNHAELTGMQLAVFPPSMGVQLTIVVDVTNPNVFDVALRGMRGQALLAEKYPMPIAYQLPGQGIWLRSGETTQLRLPVDMPIQLAVSLIREAFASPLIAFHVTGVVDVTGSSSLQVNRNDFPVDIHGTITRQQIEGVVPAMFLPH